MKNSFWKNKKVFITGHTGFKGSWLVLILNHLGAKVTGYALDPISKPNFFDNLKLSKFLENDFRDDIQNFSKLNRKGSLVCFSLKTLFILSSYLNKSEIPGFDTQCISTSDP